MYLTKIREFGRQVFTSFFGDPDLGKRVRSAVLRKAIKPGANLLDVGCGDGYVLKQVANEFELLVGLDLIAQSFCQRNAGVKCIAADAKAMPFEGSSFDVLICSDVLEHDLEFESIIAEIARVLEPNGTVYLTIPEKSNPLINGKPEHPDHVVPGFTLEEIETLLERHGMLLDHYEYYSRPMTDFFIHLCNYWVLVPIVFPLGYLSFLFERKLYSSETLGKGVFVIAQRSSA